MNVNRQQQLHCWLNEVFATEISQLLPLTGDAGFRRYFRFTVQNTPYIAVDAPTDKCNNLAFIDIQARLQRAGIIVPHIVHFNEPQGFICLSDLGNTLLSDVLTTQTMGDYYRQAIALLPTIAEIPTINLPKYDQEFVQTELNIFSDWLLTKHLSIDLDEAEYNQLQACFDILIDNALEQPQVFMHRDYHSRNIMLHAEQLAVIDFQDAVQGPITYDVVSLLRDCYVKWPQNEVHILFEEFVELISKNNDLSCIDKQQWLRWFDLMGIQRHIKASGIFARLYHRDAKSGYLKDIPLTLSYIVDVCANYPELVFLHDLVKSNVLPKLLAKTESLGS